MENISVDDLDLESIRIFKREAIRKGRMSEEDLNMPTNELMKHLGLLADGKLTRAAVLLFYRYPQRYFVGSHVKVGKFATEAELLYHDDIEGSLFVIADRVIDLIFTKYLKAKITYDHAVRVETFPFPYEGVREAVFNAIVHNNYSSGVPIQIKILDDYMYVSNEHLLPWDWTAERLINSHVSKPLNQSIANAFYRAGHIETWGRGIQIIEESCRKLGTPFPEYEILGSGIRVKFQALESAKIVERIEISKKITKYMSRGELKENIISVCDEWRSIEEIAKLVGRDINYLKNHVLPEMGNILEKLYENTPHHPRQKFRAKNRI